MGNKSQKIMLLKARHDQIITELEKEGYEAPTDLDKQWAWQFLRKLNAFFALATSGEKLQEVIAEGKLWRSAYAVKLNDYADKKDKFISNDTGQLCLASALSQGCKDILEMLINDGFVSKYGTNSNFLSLLSERRNKAILKNMVENDVININMYEQEILLRSVFNKDEKMCLFILSLGSKYKSTQAKLKKSYSKKAQRVLENAIADFEEQNGKVKPLQIEHIQVEKLGVVANDSSSDDNQWEALDDNTIVFHENIKLSQTRLQTIFNFKARNIRTICTVNKELIAPVKIQNFKDVEDDSMLYEAWNKLRDIGKFPVDFNGLDNFLVHKPIEKQNIKIEGGQKHDKR